VNKAIVLLGKNSGLVLEWSNITVPLSSSSIIALEQTVVQGYSILAIKPCSKRHPQVLAKKWWYKNCEPA
jgi:hypothetical protein